MSVDRKLAFIPDLPAGEVAKPAVDAIKMVIETRGGQRGAVEDRWVTVQDLIDLGLIEKGDMDKVLRNR